MQNSNRARGHKPGKTLQAVQGHCLAKWKLGEAVLHHSLANLLNERAVTSQSEAFRVPTRPRVPFVQRKQPRLKLGEGLLDVAHGESLQIEAVSMTLVVLV